MHQRLTPPGSAVLTRAAVFKCVSTRAAPAVENIDEQIAELEARLAGSSVNLSGGGLAGEERQRVERQLSALHRSRRRGFGDGEQVQAGV